MKKIPSVSFLLAFGLIISGCEQKNNSNEFSAYPRNGVCAIDVPANNAQLSATEDFHIGGWAFDKTTNSTTDTLTIYFKNTKTSELINVAAQVGHNRPDVAKALSISSVENSGFNAVIEKGKLTEGTYEVILMQVSKNTGAIICDSEPHLITVK